MTRQATFAMAMAALVAVLLPAPAGALPILESGDAEELVALLADATEAQDICYGWNVTIANEEAGSLLADSGSGAGVDTRADENCDRWVIFRASLRYTSSSSEAEDSADFSVESNVPNAPTEFDLRAIGINGGRLLSDNDDLAIIDATSALPLLVADRGIAPAVELAPNVSALPAGDQATGAHGSDWTRANGAALAIAICLFVLAVVWALLALVRPNWITELNNDH